MAAEIVNISEAKAQLSRLVEEVRRGKTVVIRKAGKPAACLVPYEPRHGHRSPGALAGRIHIAEDFDELPPDLAAAFGMLEDR